MIEKFINDVILKYEGFISNHPNDYGGFTIYGISQKYHPNWEGFNLIKQHKDINKIQTELKRLAIKFYISNYFSPIAKLYKTHPKSCLFLLDWFINSGYTAIKKLQEIINTYPDGIIGEDTLKKVMKYSDEELLFRLTLRRLSFVRDIIYNDPTQEVFFLGWVNRIIYVSKYLLDNFIKSP